MSDNPWIMNCVLAGARALLLLQQGRVDRAAGLLKELSSELRPEDVSYLIRRLREIKEK